MVSLWVGSAFAVILAKNVSNCNSAGLNDIVNKRQGVFFLGTSRVQHTIRPDLMSDQLGVPVYNIGVPASTLIVSLTVAEEIITRFQPELICIEISSDHKKMSRLSAETIQKMGVELSRGKRYMNEYSWREYFLENLSWENFRLMRELTLLPQAKCQLQGVLGMEPELPWGTKVVQGSIKTVEDKYFMKSCRENVGNLDVENQLNRINRLLEIARKNGVAVKFFIPVNEDVKKQPLCCAVLSNLSSEHQLAIDEAFLQTVSYAEYCYDDLHMNEDGAQVYSAQMVKVLRNLGYGKPSGTD